MYVRSKSRIQICALLLLCGSVYANIFDSFVSYRLGSNIVSNNQQRYIHEPEIDTAQSVDEAFAYTTAKADGTIHIVHCYSMRNGLQGKPRKAHVIWSQISFDEKPDPSTYRVGSAKDTLTTSLDIVAPIMHFTARDSDLTAYLLGVSKLNQLFLHVVSSGSQSSPMPYHKTYTFHSPLQLGWQFSNIKAMQLVLGGAT